MKDFMHYPKDKHIFHFYAFVRQAICLLNFITLVGLGLTHSMKFWHSHANDGKPETFLIEKMSL